MCPGCMTAAALAAADENSAGGLLALAAKKLRAPIGVRTIELELKPPVPLADRSAPFASES